MAWLEVWALAAFWLSLGAVALLASRWPAAWRAVNYQGRALPDGLGVAPVLATLAAWGLVYALQGRVFTAPKAAFPVLPGPYLTAYLLLVAGMSALGLLDDVRGDRSQRGFKGHFRALLHGRLTTGFVKAAGGYVLALLAVAWAQQNPPAVPAGAAPPLHGWQSVGQAAACLLDAALVALSANFVNLLDLRPGRAIKGYTLLALLAVGVGGQAALPYTLPLFTAVLAFAPKDLRAQALLGDAGSNPLGAAVGFAMATVWPPAVRWLFLGLLVAVHVYAEKRSLTAWIDSHPMVAALDRWGRQPDPERSREVRDR
ncbi:MAG: hypothetical protein IMW99_00605 [Firmicutes bacterium]|nr:hypothetical protein [Bacillota bacterium]